MRASWCGHLLSAALAALLSSSACYSLGILQEPKPTPPGKVRASAGIAVNVDRPLPSHQVAVRVGLWTRTEARLKLSLPGELAISGLQAGVNVQPFEGEHVSLFLMPHYRFDRLLEDTDEFLDEYPDPRAHIQAFAMPMLFVFDVRDHLLFIGPDLHVGARTARGSNQRYARDRRSYGYLAIGGHVGAGFHVLRRVYLTPELGLVAVVSGPAFADGDGEDSRAVLTKGDVIPEVSLSVSFGGRYPERAAGHSPRDSL
jgi:hypothetical protein